MSTQSISALGGTLRRSMAVRTDFAATVLVAGLLLAGKAVGFLREVFVARLFGTSSLVDAYVASMNVLQLLVWLGAALQLAVVPYFVEARERYGAGYAGRAATSALWVSAAAGLLLSVFVCLGARVSVRIAVPGLAPETARQATAMMRVLAPIGLASVMAGVAAGFQNANRRFVVARLYEPTVAFVSFMSLILVGSSNGVTALAGSQTLGYTLAALLLLTTLTGRITLTRTLPILPVCRRLFNLCWPTAAALMLFRLNSSVSKAFASSLPAGSLAALGYAERLYLLPVTLVIATVVTFHYTRAAELAVRDDIDGIAHQTILSAAKIALLLIPLTVGCCVLARPVVKLAFQRGAFDQHASAITAAVLAVYCLALLPHVVMELLTATLRGLGRMRLPMIAGATTLGVNALLCALLVRRMGAPGAAAALVGGYVAGALVMTGLVIRNLRIRGSGVRHSSIHVQDARILESLNP